MAELHLLTPDEARAIVREELRAVLDELRQAAQPAGALLTTAEVAERLRLGPDTVRAWIKSGKLAASRPPGTRDYLVRMADLEQLLAAPARPARRRDRDQVDPTSSARKILERSQRRK